ncbi:MAG TPA: transcriptional repressor LexA [Eggerthellaceae bacterium]|nr:transcriptional repressor LexA [Eggerthellaceae bacterium]
MADKTKLTRKQQAVMDSIERCIRQKGYGPTVREICSDLGLSSPSTVHVHLKTLEKKGYIVRDPLKSRSISLPPSRKLELETEEPANVVRPSFSKVVDVPLVGNVAAGEPILAEENITDTLSLPTDIVGDAPSFLLSVRGESMIEAGINDGDYVVVKEQPVANNGDIVVAILDDGATVKRFYKERDHIRLQPENSSMEPIITDNCSIAGKVVAVFRRL